MAQYIKQGSLWGRIGSGVGKGLAEQLPEEITRGRLSQGLKNLSEQKDLTPFQQFAGLASTPGATNQIVQSGADLLRQQSYLNSLKNQYGNGGPGGGYTPSQEDINRPTRGEMPSLATPQATAESYKDFIPPSEQDERRDAYENFKQNPARYHHNFDEAIAERKAITSRNQEIQQAYQGTESRAVSKEEKVKSALDNEISRLGLTNIPEKAQQKFEEKVLNAVLSSKEGGEGLTQEQAIKKYSKELDQANRNYQDLSTLSAWSPRDFNRRSNALQKDFASRGEQQQMMDALVAKELSPLYAAHKAYPIKSGQMPLLNKLKPSVGGSIKGVYSVPKMNNKTYEALKKEMGNKVSPLSIAYQLQENSQDPRGFLDYLSNHRDDLEVWQADQLGKNLNILNLTEAWLRAWEKDNESLR